MKAISWDRVMSLVCFGALIVAVAFAIVSASILSWWTPKAIAVPPNLECFQVIGEVDNKIRGYNAIEIYWCRDRNDKNACYWFRPGLEPVLTRCNKTIFKEMN